MKRSCVLLVCMIVLLPLAASAATTVEVTVSRDALRYPLYGENVGIVLQGDELLGYEEVYARETGLLWYRV